MLDLPVIVAALTALTAFLAQVVAVWRAVRELRRDAEDERSKRRALGVELREHIARLEAELADCLAQRQPPEPPPRPRDEPAPRVSPKLAIWRDAGLM